MAFELKSEILTEISKTEDERMRVVLLLMLGVMEYGAEEIKKVGQKISPNFLHRLTSRNL
jgi:hypothetical protein